MAASVRLWFMKHDLAFGMSLINLEPEQQGQEIAERYGLNFDTIRTHEDPEGYILEQLNLIEE